MFKPCPTCGFLVALIAGREASQRCPRCGSALLTESELAEIDAAAPRPPEPARRERVVAAPVVGAPQDVPHVDATAAADVPDVALEAGPVHARTDALDAPRDAMQPQLRIPPETHDGPSFTRRRTHQGNGLPRWPWIAAVAVLALLLALQLLLAQRVELARDATWRPLVIRTCGVLGCDVPAWHEPQAFAMLARGVQPSHARRGVLHVTATVRNDARWPQAPPVVVLSLSDVDGRVVGARAVAPPDYGHRNTAAVAPGDSVDIAFDVREPASHVESFDFQLQ